MIAMVILENCQTSMGLFIDIILLVRLGKEMLFAIVVLNMRVTDKMNMDVVWIPVKSQTPLLIHTPLAATKGVLCWTSIVSPTAT